MSVQRCAVVGQGLVENVIIADPAAFFPGEGLTLVTSETAQSGDIWDGSLFHAAAPAVPTPPLLTYLEFRALFTAAENQAIMTAALSNHSVLDWLLQAVGAGTIDIANATVEAGLDALVAAGLITADRETAILAGEAPPAG